MVMQLPGFTAERTPGATLGRYRTTGSWDAGASGVLTTQQDNTADGASDEAAAAGNMIGAVIGSVVGGAIGGGIAGALFGVGSIIEEVVKAVADYIAKHTPCAGGERLGSRQARSVCENDGYWHVVSYTNYMCPDGTLQTIDDHDEPTLQRCR